MKTKEEIIREKLYGATFLDILTSIKEAMEEYAQQFKEEPKQQYLKNLTQMKNLYDLEPLLDAMEGTQTVIAIMNDGTFEPFTAATDLKNVERIAEHQDLENILLKRLFSTDKMGTQEYAIMLRVFKVVHRRTPSPTKMRMAEKYNAKVVYRRGTIED